MFRYYRELRNFITLPSKSFNGVGGNAEIFKQMPERNAKLLSLVYSKAEDLFAKIVKTLDQFKIWTVISYIDEDNISKLKTFDDWENNIKMIRSKRKELEKVSEGIKIDCFSISTLSFKNKADDLLQNILETLISSLKSSIKSEAQVIEEFVTEAISKLGNKPKSMNEMAKAKEEYFSLKQKQKEMKVRFAQNEEKNQLLRNLAGFSQNLSQTQKNWETFEFAIGDFDNVLAEQTKEIKEDLTRKGDSLNNEVQKFYSRWTALKPKKLENIDHEEAKELAAKMKEWKANWQVLEGKISELSKDCAHFDVKESDIPTLDVLRAEMAEEEAGWQLYDEYQTSVESYENEDWLSTRGKLFNFQDFVGAWVEKIKKNGSKDAISKHISSQMEGFKNLWPNLKYLTGEAFEKEHWKALFNIIDLPKSTSIEKLTFGQILSCSSKIQAKQAEIKELAARAQGEISLREAIQELKVWCETTDFQLTEYKANDRSTPLIKEWKDMMTKVSDNQALLASLKESKFYGKFADQIEQFETKLAGIDDYLQKLNIIQRKWVYLDPIFSRGALPQEQSRFKRLDDEYRTIMHTVERNQKVVSLVAIPGVKDSLEMILDQLDRCQRALNEFLEEKRGRFPRFYFLGDDDLLEILGQAKNPAVIQMHLKKLFAGIHQVVFNENNTEILAMKSSADEVVNLREKLSVDEDVEDWLQKLTLLMQSTLQQLLLQCLKEKSLELGKYPSQILCLAEQIRFNQFASQALSGGKLMPYRQELTNRLNDLTGLTRSATPLMQFKLKSLILDLIHSIDILDQLLSSNANKLSEWQWLKQLRYELNKNNLAEIVMVNSNFDYTYEYQGNAAKLVHTPLTDKCYLTLTQGMAMGYGGNPYGPAGTGKTESVKALGQAFGRQVLVFNCDEGIDFKSMGRIFMGLVKCGAWGCFDEFNRLLEEQLSAISQQIQIIQWTIKEKLPNLELLGKSVSVNRNAGIFVTMNPAGKGYGGRSKLPDNLKQLFRPVAMSVPDFDLIAEVLLFSEGFKTAKVLAQKIVSIFLLSRQLLSPQQHYDWGLRALKTILTVAGMLIQEARVKTKDLDSNTESILLIKAIRINTLSKLTFSDMKKFLALLNDVFPGIASLDIVYEDLTKAINEVLAEMKLDRIDQQITKILQFYEATKQRMGVVLVGPSGCGKTAIWKVLKKAYEKMGKTVKTHIINPKSMPRSQLLGNMNNDTREFTEGVLTASAREVVKEPDEVLNWIICDGDIDPEWIESLNSVLDDNHLLTLPTGERISFGNNVNFIFETSDLSYASPATISRMGMIFLNNEDISIRSLVNEWLKKRPEDLQTRLSQLIEDQFYPLLDKIFTLEDQQLVKTTRVGLVMTVLSQLYLVKSKHDFICALARGFASNFEGKLRSLVVEQVFQSFNERPPVDVNKNPLDFFVDKGVLRVFTSIQPNLKEDDFSRPTEPPIVPTISLQRNLEILKPWVNMNESFIVVGGEGSGKELLIRAAFEELKKEMKIQIAVVHCNAQTQASQIIQKLNQVCLKGTFAKGRILKPKECSRLIIYLKDINLPKPDRYKTIQLIAFLQQILAHRGFYDDNLEFVYLDDKIQIVASMNPASTIGRHELATRFTAKMRILYIDYPSSDELKYTFSFHIFL